MPMKTSIYIVNLKCGGCANSIKKGLLGLDGVTAVSIDLDQSIVDVEARDDSVLDSVRKKLARMGYPQEGEANTLVHKAKSFVSCATGRMTAES